MSFFFSSRRRHTRLVSDWSSDVCSSDLRHNVQLHLKLARARGCVLVRNLTMNCCLSPKWSVSLETAAKPVGPASWPRSPPQGSQPRGCPRATPAASPGPVSGKTPLQFLPLSPQCTSLLAVPDTSALSYRPLSPQTPPTSRISQDQ